MSNTIIQIKRSQTTATPTTLAEGELAYSGNSVSNSLFIGLPDGSNTVTRIAGGKYGFLHSANTGNSTVAVLEGGTLTANAVVITDANSSIDEFRTEKLIVNTSGNTVNEITSVSVFANSTQLGANSGGSNVEIVTSSAIKAYVDGKTSAIGGALANQQVAFSNGTVFQGSAGLTFDFAANTLAVSNTIALGSNVSLDTGTLTIGGTTVNSTTANVLNIDTNTVVVATELSVGANIVLNDTRIHVGNSTVNSFITATGIETDGTLNVANAVTFANGLAMSNTLISNVADPVSSKDAANKAYVDEVAEGLRVKPSVEIATTGDLSATYDNGTSGVGATLTATANGAFPQIDGVTLANTSPGYNGVLVRAQSNAAHNGRYNLTTIGDGSNPWVLTRCGLCDEADEIPGTYTFVKDGTLYAGTGWVQVVDDPATFTVGTDDIDVIQFSGTGTFTAGDFLYLDGNEFNANANSSSVASVLVSRDADQNFAGNVVTVSTISATNGQFSGPISGVTTFGAGNTTITGFINVSSSIDSVGPLTVTNTASLGNTTINGFANVTGELAAGNTTISGFANVTTLDAGNTTISGFANVTGDLAAGNTTISGFINVSSTADITGALTVTDTASLGNTTVTGFINVTSSADVVGPLSVTNTAGLGNTTITGFANITSTLAAGNTQITGFANVSSFLNAGNTTISGYANVSGSLTVNTDLSVIGNVTLGSNSAANTLIINAKIDSDIVPASNLTHSVGNSSLWFAEIYASNLISTSASFSDLSVSGNLTVSGTLTTIDTVNLVVEDPLIKLARNNESDSLDIGFYGKYANTPNKWTGLFRDSSDTGVWKLFHELEVQPTDSSIDTSNNTFTLATLESYIKSGALTTNSTALAISSNSTYSVTIGANSVSANIISVSGSSNNSIFFANGSGSLVELTLGVEGKVLQSNGTAVVYGDLDGGTF